MVAFDSWVRYRFFELVVDGLVVVAGVVFDIVAVGGELSVCVCVCWCVLGCVLVWDGD